MDQLVLRRIGTDRAAGRRACGGDRNDPAGPGSEGIGAAREGIGPAGRGIAACREPTGGLERSARAPARTRRTGLV